MAFGLGTITGGISSVLGGAANMLYGKSPTPQAYNINQQAYVDPNDAAMRAQMAQAYGQYSQAATGFLGGQQQLVGQLQQQAAGNAPSLAQMQMAQAMQQGQAQQMGSLASQRGINPGMAARLGAMGSAQMTQDIAGQAAQARMQEQQAAQQQLAGALAQGQQFAGGQQQYYNTQQMSQDEANRQALMQQQQLGVQQQTGINQMVQQGAASQQQARAGLVQGVGMGLAMKSEKDLKEDIKPANDKMQKFLDALKAKEYEYKDESLGKGKQYGVMADDMMKSEIGKTFIKETDDGKAVDYAKGFHAMMAAMAHMNEKMKKLEKGA